MVGNFRKDQNYAPLIQSDFPAGRIPIDAAAARDQYRGIHAVFAIAIPSRSLALRQFTPEMHAPERCLVFGKGIQSIPVGDFRHVRKIHAIVR